MFIAEMIVQDYLMSIIITHVWEVHCTFKSSKD